MTLADGRHVGAQLDMDSQVVGSEIDESDRAAFEPGPVSAGWKPRILSGLTTLLETGEPLTG
jgi:hypothetical protein